MAFLLRHNMTKSQFQEHVDSDLLEAGARLGIEIRNEFPPDPTRYNQDLFKITTVTSYHIDGQTYYTVLYNVGEPLGFYPYIGLTLQNINKDESSATAKCPTCVNAFTVNDTDYYNTVWNATPYGCPVDWIRDLEIIGVDAFMNKHDDRVKAGYRPLWVSGFGSTEHKFATLWNKKSAAEGGALKVNLKAADLTNEIDKSLAQGLQPVLINGYAIKGTSWYVAIFEPVGKDGKTTARYGMTELEYKSYEDQQTCAGYNPVHISAWTERQVRGREGVRFAAVWKK
eukprot:jgi/Chrzof1/3738/Cz13g07040.t1